MIAPSHPRPCSLQTMLCAATLAAAIIHGHSLWAVLPPASEVTPVAVQPEEDVSSTWSVKQAEITQNFHVLWAMLRVENISAHPVMRALFYGEYYDRRGRLCYTALFDLQKNKERRTGPALPGSGRTLVSISINMAMASRPRLVRVYLLRQLPAVGVTTHPRKGPGIYTPAMLKATTIEPWETICLGPASGRSALPVTDVALMMADVNPQGRVSGLKVLDAATTVPFVSWAQKFATHIRFSPSRTNGSPVNGKTLVLFRGLLREWTQGDPAEVASSNPWVVKYADSEAVPRIPAVTVVVLQPPPPHAAPVREGSASGCVEYVGTGSYWSEGIALSEHRVP